MFEDEQDLELHANYILITDGGRLQVIVQHQYYFSTLIIVGTYKNRKTV